MPLIEYGHVHFGEIKCKKPQQNGLNKKKKIQT